MKKLFSIVTVFAVAAFVGCNSGSEKKTKVNTEKGGEFTLKAPNDTTLKQGESKEITVSVERKDFKDPINLEFKGLPDGVSIKEGDKQIGEGKNEIKFTLEATEKAKKMKDQMVEVKGSGGGSSGTVKFKLNVEEKK